MTNESLVAKGNGVKYTAAGLLLLLIFLFIYYFCHSSGGGTGKSSSNKGPLKAPHGIEIIDINGDSLNVPVARVYLIDPEDKVVSANEVAFDTVEITDGVMSVGLLPDAVFSEESPYRYSIRVEADGYATVLKTIVITRDVPNYIPVYMAKLDNLPSGSRIAGKSGAISSVNNGLLSENVTLEISADAPNKPLPLTITFDAGTRFLANGAPITQEGPVEYRLLLGAPNENYGNRLFPGGFLMTDGIDQNGDSITPANPRYITTAGWFSLEMSIRGIKVDGFSNPVRVNMGVESKIKNPATDSSIQSGKTIPIWSLNDNTGIWQSDSTAVVSNDYTVDFSITHLSSWTLSFTTGFCAGFTPVTYVFDPTTGFSGNRYTRLTDASTGGDLQAGIVDFDAERVLKIFKFPTLKQAALIVHDGASPATPIIGNSKEGQPLSCQSACNCLLRTNAVAPPCTIQIKFQRTTSTGTVLPAFTQNSVWYKAPCSAPLFNFAGVVGSATGIVRVPYPSGPFCARVWFLHGGSARYLDFPLNPTQVPGSYTGTIAASSPTGWYFTSGVPTQFDYAIQNAACPGTNRIVTITLRNGSPSI